MYNKKSYSKKPITAFKGLGYFKTAIIFFIISTLSSASYGQNYLTIENTSMKISGNFCMKAKNVVLQQNGKIQMTSNESNLTIIGDLTNNSGIVANLKNGNVTLKGNENQKIKGNKKVVFKNLEINKTGNNSNVILNQDIDVTGFLNLTKGTLDITNNNINLFSTGMILNETNENRIKATNGTTEGAGNGKIIATRVLNYGNNLNIAGLGIDINSNSFVGLKTIERSHKEIWTNSSDVPSICRSFTFSDFGNVTEYNNFSIHYFQSELNGLNESDLAIYKVGNSENISIVSTKLDNFNKKAITSSEKNDVAEDYSGVSTYTLFPKINITNSELNNLTNQNASIKESSNEFKAFYASNSKSIIVNFKSDAIENYTIEVYNASSKKVSTINFPVNLGENNISIDASNLSKSMYIITMISNANRFSSKIIINK